MALTFAQFSKVVRREENLLKRRKAPIGVSQCATCDIPLQETITGNRPLKDGRHLCSDCYFDEMDKEVALHPIITPRRARGA